MLRRALLIASLSLLPALAGCGETSDAQPPAELSVAALQAVAEDAGAPRDQLARAIDRLFADDSMGATRAVIVMYGGKVVGERYATGFGPETRFLGWSLSKTVTAVAVGLLVAEGKLRLDQTPPIPRWQRPGDPRGEITLRQLLQMRSGLRNQEMAEKEYEGSAARLLFMDGRDDMAGEAEAQPLESEPGARFEYSTASAVILADIVTRVLAGEAHPARRQAVTDRFLRDRLFAPLGLESMTAEYDAAGTFIGGAMIHATARDWARFGEFLRHGGSVKGAQILPRGWIAFMRKPSPRAPDYGAQLWLNRPSGGEREVLFPAQGPADAFGMAGHLGQYVIVSPRQRLTVVRLGMTDEEHQRDVVRGIAGIFALYPVR